MQIIDGKAVSAQIKLEIAEEVVRLKSEGKKHLIWLPFSSGTMVEAKRM